MANDIDDIKEKDRRQFLNRFALGGVAVGMAAYGGAVSAAPAPSNIRYVGGVGRDFQTVQAALASILDAAADNPYLVLVDPGIYNIQDGFGPIALKSHVAIAGVDRGSTVFIGTEGFNFRCASHSSLSNFTIRYTGAKRDGGAIKQNVNGLQDFRIDTLTIYSYSRLAAFSSPAYIEVAEIYDTTIVTRGVGIDIGGGGHVYIHDSNIHLISGRASSTHVGIQGAGYCRIYVFGGKIGTGYGYPELADPSSSVIGVRARAGASGRIHLFNVWSICRNDSPDTRIAVNCVRNDARDIRVRLFGGYFQSENPQGPNTVMTIDSPGGGKIEVYGTRYKNIGAGHVASANQVGLQTYTTADDGTVIGAAEGGTTNGGLILVDAARGPFTLRLPTAANTAPTEQFIFKKIDESNNAVTIDGFRMLIDGKRIYTLTKPYQRLHVRYANECFYIVG